MVGVVPPLGNLKSEEDLQREADLARDKPVQDMLDVLGIDYPGGFSSRLPEPYQSTMRLLSRTRDAGRSSPGGSDGFSPSSSGGIGGLNFADTTVNIFRGGVGHAGVAVGSDPSRGFYPVQPDLRAGYEYVPGEVRNDDMNRPHDSVTFPTTPAQEAAIRRSMQTHSQDDYNLFLNNCLQWARDRLRDGGVSTQPQIIPMPGGFIETQKTPWIR